MTSSASAPGWRRTGTRNASNIRRTVSICGPKSSGIGPRWALYSGNASARFVFPAPSNAAARYSGLRVLSIASRSRNIPKTAFVGCPAGPVISGTPWKFW